MRGNICIENILFMTHILLFDDFTFQDNNNARVFHGKFLYRISLIIYSVDFSIFSHTYLRKPAATKLINETNFNTLILWTLHIH